MKLSRCNVMSVGIFSWVSLEPEEEYLHLTGSIRFLILSRKTEFMRFWLHRSCYRHGWHSNIPKCSALELTVYATSMACAITTALRRLFTGKTAIINGKLAERYGNHPAVLGWHISNEFSGECHCDYARTLFATG